jgi:hypothetical protein
MRIEKICLMSFKFTPKPYKKQIYFMFSMINSSCQRSGIPRKRGHSIILQRRYSAEGEVYARLDTTRSLFKFHSNILLANKARLKTWSVIIASCKIPLLCFFSRQIFLSVKLVFSFVNNLPLNLFYL